MSNAIPTKKVIVLQSGGMDSAISLAVAIREFGAENILSMTIDYDQRHSAEIDVAKKISKTWGVDHTVIKLDCLKSLTVDALTHPEIEIEHLPGQPPNTLVTGRNGLFAHLAGIHVHHLGGRYVYMGVIEVEKSNSGYRDCTRDYIDKVQAVLRIDLDDPDFEIRTPVVFMSKCQTYQFAQELGILDFLLENTITCYRGIPREGCGECPSCVLRIQGLHEFAQIA